MSTSIQNSKFQYSRQCYFVVMRPDGVMSPATFWQSSNYLHIVLYISDWMSLSRHTFVFPPQFRIQITMFITQTGTDIFACMYAPCASVIDVRVTMLCMYVLQLHSFYCDVETYGCIPFYTQNVNNHSFREWAHTFFRKRTYFICQWLVEKWHCVPIDCDNFFFCCIRPRTEYKFFCGGEPHPIDKFL